MNTAVAIDPKRLERFEAALLKQGSHTSVRKGGCMIEWVGYLAGQPWGDNPPCVDPVVRRFCIRLNDRWNDEERQLLKPLALRVIGTKATKKIEMAREWLLTDWVVRTLTPMWLVWAGQGALAAELQALHPIVAAKDVRLALDPLRRARDAAAYADAYDAAAYAAAYADAYADAADDGVSRRRLVVNASLEILERLIDLKLEAVGRPGSGKEERSLNAQQG